MRWILILLLAMPPAAAGWWGLYELTRQLGPLEAGALPSFYALLCAALTATVMPFVAYLNHRLATAPARRSMWTALRRSAWVGLCLTSWAWLQMQRAFNVATALIIAMIFVAVEALIVRLRSKA